MAEPPQPPPRGSPSGCRRRPMRIFVIEDDDTTREILASELARAGYAVFQADTGADGLAEFKRVRPDAIVLDLMLPELNGFSVARAVRELDTSDRLKIVAVSALVSGPLRAQALAVGCDAFLGKPVSAAQVIAQLQSLLGAGTSTGTDRSR